MLYVRHLQRFETLKSDRGFREKRMETNDENKALGLAQWLSDQAINGFRPLSSAHDLADEYLLDRGIQKSRCARRRLQLELRLQELKLRVLKAQISVNKA
jgi:hypothetical protein